MREGWHLMRAENLKNQFRYMLRVTLQITDGGIGKINYDVDSERKSRDLMAEKYPDSENHIAIFECELKQPPILSLANHSH